MERAEKNRSENLKAYLEPRVAELRKHGFHLEAFYLYSAALEHRIRIIIPFQEEWIEKVLKKSRIRFKKTETGTLERKTLGELIGLFSRYCDDEKLVSRLDDYNKFRIKIVHKLLDDPFSQVNEYAKSKHVKYYTLVIDINEYGVFVLEKHIASNTRKIQKLKS